MTDCFYDKYLQAFKIYDMDHFEWDRVEGEDFCEQHIANIIQSPHKLYYISEFGYKWITLWTILYF